MKSFRAFLLFFLVIALPVTLGIATETATDSDSTELNNPNTQSCGVYLSLPDYLCRNTDDDQGVSSEYYEKWDLDHSPSPGDDDLKVVTVTGTAGPTGGTLTLEITDGSEKINGVFWKDSEKEEEEYPLSWEVLPNESRTVTLYIEGYDHSDEKDDVKMKATMDCPAGTGSDGKNYSAASDEATAETTVYEVDLDVDSNNDNQFTFDGFNDDEDKLEASEKTESGGKKKPGKYTFVNGGFNANNNDGTPRWADGFNINTSDTEDDEAAVFKFTPLQIKLKKPFEPGKAKIKFTYFASNPAGVNSTGGGGTPDHPYTYTLSQDGQLRIWKKDGPGTRGKASVAAATDAGDFVPKDADIDWSKIGSGDTAQLYLEAVRPSGALGDLVINIEVTQDDVKCTDEVRVTSVYLGRDKIEVKPDQAYSLTNFPPNYRFEPPVGSVAANVTAEAVFVPDGADPYAYPLSDIKVGIIQNVQDVSYEVYRLFSVRSWRTDAPIGSKIKYPDFLRQWAGFTERTNDTDAAAAPLYGDSAIIELVTPGSGPCKVSDSPYKHGALEYFETQQHNGSDVAEVYYNLISDVRINADFVVWITGYSLDSKQIYPLVECPWSLNVASSNAMPQKADCGTQRGNTMVPIRLSPFANDKLKLPENRDTSPAPGAVFIEETR